MPSPLSLQAMLTARQEERSSGGRSQALQRLLRAQELDREADQLQSNPEYARSLQEAQKELPESDGPGFLERVSNLLNAPGNALKNFGESVGNLGAAGGLAVSDAFTGDDNSEKIDGALKLSAASAASIAGNLGEFVTGGNSSGVFDDFAGKIEGLRDDARESGIKVREGMDEDEYGRMNSFEANFTPWDAADTLTGYEDSEFGDWTLNDAVQSAMWGLEILGDPSNLIGAGAKPAALIAKNASRVRHIANARTAKVVLRGVDGLADDAAKEIAEFAIKNGNQFDKTALTAQLIKKGVKADEAARVGKEFDSLAKSHFQDLIEGSATDLRKMHVDVFGESSKATKQFDQLSGVMDKRGIVSMLPKGTFAEQAEVGQRSLRHAIGLGRLDKGGRAAKILDGANQHIANLSTYLNSTPGKGAKLFKGSSQEARLAGATAERAVKDSIRQGANMASEATISSALARVSTLARYPTLGGAVIGAGIGAISSDDSLAGAAIGGGLGLGVGGGLAATQGVDAIGRSSKRVQDALRHGLISDVDSLAVAEVEAYRAMISDGISLSLDDTNEMHRAIKEKIASVPKSEQSIVQERIIHQIEAGKLTQAEKNRLVSEGRLSEGFANYQSLRNDEYDPVVREVAEIIGGDSEFLRKLQVANDSFVSQLDDVFDYFPRVPSREMQDLAERFPEVMAVIREGRENFFNAGTDTAQTKTRKLRGVGTIEGNLDMTSLQKEVNRVLDGRATLKDVFETDVASVFMQQRRRAAKRIERARVLHAFMDNVGTEIQEDLAMEGLAGVKASFQEALDDGAEAAIQSDVVAKGVESYFSDQAVKRSVEDTGRSISELQSSVDRVSRLSPRSRKAIERQVEGRAKLNAGTVTDAETPNINNLADQVDLLSSGEDALPPLSRLFEDAPRASDAGGESLARGTKVFDETVEQVAREFPDISSANPEEIFKRFQFMPGYAPMERARKAGLIRVRFARDGSFKISPVDGFSGPSEGIKTKHMEKLANDLIDAAKARQEVLIGKRQDANKWTAEIKREITMHYGGEFEDAAERAISDMTNYQALGDDAKASFLDRIKKARDAELGAVQKGPGTRLKERMPDEIEGLFDHLYQELEGKIATARDLTKRLESIDEAKGTKRAKDAAKAEPELKGKSVTAAKVKLKRLEEKLEEHRRGFARLMERTDIRNADELIQHLPQDARISLVENMFKDLEVPEGHVSGLEALRMLKSNSAIPRTIEDIARLRTRFIPEAEIAPYKRFNELMAPNGRIHRLLGKANRIVKTGLLSAPTSIVNEAIQQIIQYTTIAGGGGAGGLKWLGHAIADMSIGAKDQVLSKLYPMIGKEFKLDMSAKALNKAMVDTVDGKVGFYTEKAKAARAGLFDMKSAIGEETSAVRSFADIFKDTNKGPLGKAGEAFGKPFRHMVEMREKLENISKTGLYMAKREEGMSVRDAVNEVRKYFFDFDDVTKMERKHARNYLTFYTWAKKSAPMFARAAIEKPAKMRLLMLAVGATGPNSSVLDENTEGTYMESLVSRKIGKDAGGNPLYMSMGGNPFDVQSLFANKNPEEFARDVASRTNPLIKLGIEGLSGVDMFTGRPTGFGDPTAAMKGFTADRAPSWIRHLPEVAQEMLGFGEKLDRKDPSKLIKYTMNPKLRFLFENVLPLSAWSRSTEVALASDERKTTFNQRLGLLGIPVRSLPGARPEAKLERDLRKLSDSILSQAHDQKGAPFTVIGGQLRPNKSTKAGQKVLEELDRGLLEAATILEERGIDINSRNEEDRAMIADTMLFTEQKAMNRFWPEASAKADTLVRIQNARDYLRDPEKIKKRHEKRVEMLRERAYRARMAALGVPSFGLKLSAAGREVEEAKTRLQAR